MRIELKSAKQCLRSWQRLQNFNWLAIAFGTPEAELFKKEKSENPEFEHDNIWEWLIKKALSFLDEGEDMPTIICSYCEYVGQGGTFEEQITDVECHEETECKARPEEEKNEENEN